MSDLEFTITEKLMALQLETEKNFQEEIEKLFSAPTHGSRRAKDLAKVSSLLESSKIGQRILGKNFHGLLSTLAKTLITEITRRDDAVDTGIIQTCRVPAKDPCYQVSKVFLQMCRNRLEELQMLLWQPSAISNAQMDGAVEDLHHIISGLITLLEDQPFSKDTGLMAGSSLAMMLNSAPIPKQAASIIKCLLSRYSGTQIDRSPMNLEIGNVTVCRQPLISAMPLSLVFSQLAILRGILTCCDKAILLEDLRVSTSDQDQTLAVSVLFPVVCSLCRRAEGELKYHAIEALSLYLQAMKRIIPVGQRDTLHPPLFGKDSEQMQTILRLVWQEWQSPVDGVTEMTRSALSALLDLHCLESKEQGIESTELVDSITSSLLDTAWHVKGRYRFMTTLLPHHGSVVQLLKSWPNLPRDMLKCLGTNYLAAAAIELYSTLMKRMRREVVGARRKGEGEEDFAEKWASIWKENMLQGLCNQDSLLRYHTSTYWLPSTVKSFPGSFQLLMKVLDQESSKQLGLLSDEEREVRNLHARIVLLKCARMNGILDSNWLDTYRDIVSAGLWHTEDSIQENSLSLLCCSPKKSELPSDSEICLIRETFLHFLNSDSAAFRNQLRHNISVFVVRLCAGSLWLLKRLKKIEAMADKNHCDKDQEKIRDTLDSGGETVQRTSVVGNSLLLSKSTTPASLEEKLMMAVDCLDWMAEVCFGSLFPGACYQRKRAAMDVLGVIFKNLLSQNKQQTINDSSSSVTAWASEHGKCNLLSEKNASLLLECIQDGANDLRSSSYDLLSAFFPAALPSSPAYPYTSSSQILCLALQLVSSPKLQESEAGALLTKMIFYKHSVSKSLKNSDENPATPPGSPIASNGPSTEKGTVHFVTSLLSSLTYQLKCCKMNLLQAACATPMHGLIRAIRRCLTDHPSKLQAMFQAEFASWSFLVKELLTTLKDITSFILLILSGQERITQTSDSGSPTTQRAQMAPSFGQMGEAIERLIMDLAACRTDVGDDGADLTTAMSEEHQLILACCWLNLKECSLLLGSLVETLPLCSENKRGILTFEQVTLMADILVDILTRCRHKGAIEGCNHGFSKLCSRLLVSHNPKLQALPKTLLDRVLRIATDQEAGSSLSKKSAGLPLLVESIISAEPRGRERPLLSYAMTNLMSIASQPLPPNPNERLDLPQSHALNIMMALFRCSTVGTDILRHCSEAVRMAIGGFASPCWMIRNCSMRLFGTLIARIFGQKRVHDEHSQINAMSAATFFSRYPDLRQLLLQEIRKFSETRPVEGIEQNVAEDGTQRREVIGDETKQKNSEGNATADSVEEMPGRLHKYETGKTDSKLQRNCSKTRRLLLHPSLHPVLTLLSKLGPGVGNEDIETLCEFRQPVRRLASSPIYAVRELAAQALVPLVPQADKAKLMAEIIKDLPSEATSASNFNCLHGNLLQVEKLLKTAIQNSMPPEDIFLIQTCLKSKIWIAWATNPCALVRALFVRIALVVIAEAQCVCADSGATDLVLEMQAVVKEYFGSNPPFQIGIACLNKVMSTAQLDFLKMTSAPLTSHLLTSAYELLNSQDSDVKLAALDFLQNHLKEVVHCSDSQALQTFTDKLGHLIVDPSLENRCLEKALSLWVDFSNRTESKTSLACDWSHVWEALTGLVEGRRGSGLIAAALPAIGWCLQCNLETSITRTKIDQWSLWMVKYSHPSQSETIRLAVVRSMRTAAPAVWTHLATKQMEDGIDVALDLMKVLLHLLQDEDQDIRLETAAVVSLQLPRGDRCLQYRHLHSNAAQQVLVDYVCRTFSWSRKFMSSVLSLLRGSIDVSEFFQGSAYGTSGTHLFEQERANIYAEGVMEARVVYQALVDTLDRKQTLGSEKFKNWLGSWYEGALCLQASREDLEITRQILETGLTTGGTFYGLSSRSIPYEAIYRQLLYTKFLCTAAKRLEIDEKTMQAVNGIEQSVQKIRQMPSVHPCLKTELSAFLQFL